MTDWRKQLHIDPIPVLLDCGNEAIIHFTRLALLGEKTESVQTVWNLSEPRKIIGKQQSDGSWGKAAADPGVHPPNHRSLVETFKNLRILVERFQFTREHPSLAAAAEFLFSFQTSEGDIRGFIGNQYATYYTGYVLSLLIQAGYERDPRVIRGLEWLLSIRQDDGGWTVPFVTHPYDRQEWLDLTSKLRPALKPDRKKPFSHMATDMVLRAFAAHPKYRKSKDAEAAGALLKSRFFKPDAYTSYQSPKYWTRFVFWWPNLLTALDSLALLGFPDDEPDIRSGIDWFIDNQCKDGLWKLESGKPAKAKDLNERVWLCLRICRMMKRYEV